jgi:V8-like Glu-specific endopeptidase
MVQDVNGNILQPLSSSLSSTWSSDTGPQKCHDGNLATVCASAERTGAVLFLTYADSVASITVFNRVNCLSCATRIVGGTIEVHSPVGSFTDSFYPQNATVQGSTYNFRRIQERFLLNGLPQTEYGTIEPDGSFRRFATVPALDESNSARHHRSMKAQPRNLRSLLLDDRTVVSPEWKVPYSAVGVLLDGDGYQCTGVVISRTSILTSAHCVYDFAAGQVRKDFKFTPGGFDHSGVSLYGTWSATHRVIICADYQTLLNANGASPGRWAELAGYDIALIELGGKSGRYVGDVAAIFGMRPTLANSPLPADRTASGGFMVGPDAALV